MPLHTPSQRCPFCFAKVPISHRKSAYFTTQKCLFCNAKAWVLQGISYVPGLQHHDKPCTIKARQNPLGTLQPR